MMRSLRLAYGENGRRLLGSTARASALLLAGLAVGCSPSASIGSIHGEGHAGNQGQNPSGADAGQAGDPLPAKDGGVRTPELPPQPQTELNHIREQLGRIAELKEESLSSEYPAKFGVMGSLSGTPVGLDRVQNSPLALQSDELAKLNELGFVITDRHSYPNFTYGFREIYAEHLPLYISVDSILEAVHRSYDDILTDVERGVLVERLSVLLDRARSALPGLPAGQVRSDLDVYFAVARSLLSGSLAAPVADGDAALVETLVAAANAAAGAKQAKLFGVDRTEDFSQYKPRGHYEHELTLQGYFRATMWLGRIDFRFLETQADGSLALRRPQVEAALTLRELLDSTALDAYKTVDDVVRAFVGEPDFLTLEQLDPLRADLGINRASELASIDDQTLKEKLANVGYGRQRILSAIVINGGNVDTLPLSLSFALLGQRYVIDSHVFSSVVYDRVVPTQGHAMRMMPNPLDVAFAALGNNAAGPLLASELRTYGYAPQLGTMRALADSHDQTFWSGNLYNLWTSALRALSSSGDVAASKETGMPTVTTTEPWARRVLNAQLASWAELRHDTILYAKQSYSTGVLCEFPDSFVDPYPKFFSALESFSARGTEVASMLPSSASVVPGMKAYFATLGSTSAMLRQMAEAELAGSQFTSEQKAFVDQAVTIAKVPSGCTTEEKADGWYPLLHYSAAAALDFDPTIADVHTQPTDEAGNTVGRVLHVGTGSPRVMVAALDRCGTPSAYVGLVSSYFETTTKNFQRLTDSEWSKQLQGANPADVPWMSDLVVR